MRVNGCNVIVIDGNGDDSEDFNDNGNNDNEYYSGDDEDGDCEMKMMITWWRWWWLREVPILWPGVTAAKAHWTPSLPVTGIRDYQHRCPHHQHYHTGWFLTLPPRSIPNYQQVQEQVPKSSYNLYHCDHCDGSSFNVVTLKSFEMSISKYSVQISGKHTAMCQVTFFSSAIPFNVADHLSSMYIQGPNHSKHSIPHPHFE